MAAIRLRSLVMTCSACPSQWEGKTDQGQTIYVHYRYGNLTWGIGATLAEAIDASIAHPGLDIGGEWDGRMDTHQMLGFIGATLRSV